MDIAAWLDGLASGSTSSRSTTTRSDEEISGRDPPEATGSSTDYSRTESMG